MYERLLTSTLSALVRSSLYVRGPKK